MSHNRKLVARIALRLIKPNIGISSLDKLAFEMHPGQILAHNIGAVNTTLKLYAAARSVAVRAQQFGQFKLAALAFTPGIDACHRGVHTRRRSRIS